ncbi:cupin domain-containing protein [Pseudoroseomonas ludipueritiae]|uniref:Cupin domain-containing protein n=1 Tax=Pseudoroseomonas ludipueritiae TaxID=198093 RepID=A0ABR7RAL3_9PROT|nr:cupin domain-containing protein [Pseudoroseomonas ludipueritiae]MBC9178686.1 cupin domain-containing protein [Pseudoroseomonas ludipueritiae]MCG7364364.1 cupin domain-containing protein [Roseomonas sp. ACRSG]
MITRRIFGGCALCAAVGLVAAPASAQAPSGIKRTTVKQEPLPGTNYVTIQMMVEVEAQSAIARHTHPGHEATYIISGGMELNIEGQDVLRLKGGDSFLVPAGVPHSGRATEATRFFATYVVDKDKPLSSPAPG